MELAWRPCSRPRPSPMRRARSLSARSRPSRASAGSSWALSTTPWLPRMRPSASTICSVDPDSQRWNLARSMAVGLMDASIVQERVRHRAILDAIRDAFPLPRLRVADRGLREGMLVEMMREDGVLGGCR